MNKKKTLILLILLYIGLILGFGTIYWTYWYFNPDSFVISDQLNLHPFSNPRVLGENYDLHFYQKKADSLNLLATNTQESFDSINHLMDSIEPLINPSFQKLEDARWDSIEKWKTGRIPDSIKYGLQYLDDVLKNYDDDNYGNVYIATLRVEKAKLEYEKAKINVESGDYVLKNLRLFADSSLLSQFVSIDTLYSLYKYDVTTKLSLETRRLASEIEELRYEALGNFSKRIGIMDFLLFSASNSSTVTYGEVVPNDNFTRVLLFIQAILCIAFMGIFIDRIMN